MPNSKRENSPTVRRRAESSPLKEMLTHLHIENYALIDSLDISFPEGLVIITGETGAGKSILLGALSLVLGAKADVSVIGDHGESCVVEAEFDVEDDPLLSRLIEENDLERDGNHLTVRRTIAASGRSRGFVNDSPVPVGVLQELSSRLVDIHSQHDTRLLTDRRYALSALDAFAGNGPLLKPLSESWARLQALRKDLSDSEEKLRRLTGERDYIDSRFHQLESAKLREGELEELEAEQRQVANAEEIKSGLSAVQELFDPSDGRESLNASLKDSGKILSRLSSFIPSLGELSSRMDSARFELEDILSEVEKVSSRVEFSPERLTELEQRLSLLYSLMKKFGCSDIPSLIAERDSLGETLFDSSSLEERVEELRKALTAEEKVYADLSSKLHERRVEASGRFAEGVRELMRFLELESALFLVEIREAQMGPDGTDAVLFLFSSTGRAPLELSKCASGGELSRIMLGLKAMMARYADMPTLVFDEIDTGVSGSAADKMGSMICSMGEDMQVFAITHLPQVAAKGSAHYLVSKENSVSSIRRIEGEDRVREIARMLSGSTIGEAAVRNARELLDS